MPSKYELIAYIANLNAAMAALDDTGQEYQATKQILHDEHLKACTDLKKVIEEENERRA